jgi:hypothetical protein
MGIEGLPEYRTIRKYVGDPFHFVHNIPVIRLPEIYLSIAEAYANTGNMAEASAFTSLVSMPRRKATTNVISVTNVLDERRRELILEGHTFWDYFRTGRNMTGRQIIEASIHSSITFGVLSPNRSHRVVYALPLSELNANPAIRDQQNPGYAGWTSAIDDTD